MINIYSLALNLFWQSALIACVVGLVLYILPAPQVKTRYRIALGGLLSTLCLLGLPFLPEFAPNISVGITPSSVPVLAQTISVVDTPALPIKNPQSVTATNSMPSLGQIVMGLWCMGIGFMLMRLVSAALQGKRWRTSANPAKNLSALNLSQPVHISRSSHILSPLVLGFWRPIILVPQSFDLHPDNRQSRAVLEHEIAHIARGDLWMNFAQRLVLALFWWCVPLYWINSQIHIEREKLCDDIATQKCGNGRDKNTREQGRALARALVELAEQQIRNPAPLLAIGIRPSARQLSVRVLRLYKGTPIMKISKKLLLTTSLAVPVTLASLALITPRAFAHNPLTGHIDLHETRQDISPEQLTLYGSVEHGDTQTIQNLLARGVDPNFVLHGDGTPLFVAVRKSDLSMIKLLVNGGADVNLAAPGDGNPLIQAAMRGHVDIAKFLLAKGADINAIVPGDETPLINAAQQGYFDMVKFLIANGADINLGAWANHYKGNKGEWRTPLGEAKKHGHTKLAKYLTQNGASHITRSYDPNTKNMHTEITTYGSQNHKISQVKIVEGRLTSPYGQVRKGKMFAGKKHRGIDIANKLGTPIYAPADGQVQVFNEFSFSKNYGPVEKYGKTLELETAGGVKTLFAHLQSFAVRQGESVKAGDIIAYVGNSGVSSGPHVHIETHRNDTRIDPVIIWPSLK